MKNIKETVDSLRQKGLVVGITSVGPSFASDYFKNKFGFDFSSGSEHEFINSIHSGKLINILAGKDKVLILEQLSKEKGIVMREIIAVGDSRSDIPIFEKVGFRIALNADENLKTSTDLFIHSENLFDVSNEILDL